MTTPATIIETITAMGRADATEHLACCGQIAECDLIDDSAISRIRAILRSEGDARSDLLSLGYLPSSLDLRAAYAAGWDEIA